MTGLDEKTRARVAKLSQENGGIYSGELTKDVCTHLLVGNTNSECVQGLSFSGCGKVLLLHAVSISSDVVHTCSTHTHRD